MRSLAFAVAIASLLASAAAAPGAAKMKVPKALEGIAPADQYFGPFKISVPGMAARMKDLGDRYHAREIDDHDIVHDAKFVEDAIDAWHTKYPKDPGVPRTAFTLEQLYQVVQSTNARTHATNMLKFIAKFYPDTKEAHLSRLRLAQGFPPLQPETPTHATPDPFTHGSPSAVASPGAATSPSAPASGTAASPAADASAPASIATAAAATASAAAAASAKPSPAGAPVSPAAAASTAPSPR